MNAETKTIIKETLKEIERQRKACRHKRKTEPEEDKQEEKKPPIKHRIRKEEAWRNYSGGKR